MLPVRETVSPPAVFATVMTRTGRISGASGFSVGLHATSRLSIESTSREVRRPSWLFLPLECESKGSTLLRASFPHRSSLYESTTRRRTAANAGRENRQQSQVHQSKKGKLERLKSRS